MLFRDRTGLFHPKPSRSKRLDFFYFVNLKLHPILWFFFRLLIRHLFYYITHNFYYYFPLTLYPSISSSIIRRWRHPPHENTSDAWYRFLLKYFHESRVFFLIYHRFLFYSENFIIYIIFYNHIRNFLNLLNLSFWCSTF